jgi:two-component system, OmpR family, response regulator
VALVLLVEDDASIRTALSTALEHDGHQVAAREHGDDLEACGTLDLTTVDVAIVDVGLPQGPDGIELAHMLTSQHDVPVIILTAQGDFEVKAAGYRAGADLYVTKPFSVAELLWQLEALLRRTGAHGRDVRPVTAGALSLDLTQRIAWHRGEELALSPIEFDLLAVLVRHHGKAVSKARLLDLVWEHDVYDTNLVETAIRRLRAKLAERDPTLIETVRGAGYRLRA